MKQITYISLSLTLLLLAACSGGDNAPAATTHAEAPGNLLTLTTEQLKNAGLQTDTVTRRSMAAILRVTGTVDVPPQNMVSVSVPLGGYLSSTHLLPGMHVNKGEEIAVLEDQQYIQLQQDYLVTKEKLQYSRQDYERQRILNEDKASSDKTVQAALADLRTLEISLKALGEKLELIGIHPSGLNAGNISRSIRLRSPINGYVTRVNVNIGKFVSPTDVLFEMVNPEDIHLNLRVFERDLPRLSIGQKLQAWTNNRPEKKYPCEILLIGKELGDERNTEVHCHFEQYDKTLIPGTYMNAEIAVTAADRYALPEAAVVRFENHHYVFVRRTANRFEMLQVESGITEGGFSEIINGDALSGLQVVTKGAYTLLMALKNQAEE